MGDSPQKKGRGKKALKIVLVGLVSIIVGIGGVAGIWAIRPNTADVNPALNLEIYDVVKDGTHNSNTDMILWNETFYLVHASSPFHFASDKSHLLLKNSTDGKNWTTMATFKVEGEDIRDPKICVINNTLFLYALKNVDWTAEPYTTVWSSSADGGLTWNGWHELTAHEGWLFWRPKTNDNLTWYAPAYWWEHGKSILLQTTDGMNWTKVGNIYEGEVNDETAIEFLPNGDMICTARLEVSGRIIGHKEGNTLLGVAAYPYTSWNMSHSLVTRLDGPYLFSYHDRIYALGRYQPNTGFLSRQGSAFAKKRTSLFLVESTKLTWLSDLPSSGDTSYGAVVIRNGVTYIDYYTSRIDRDPGWLMGMLGATAIKMVTFNMTALEGLVS